MKLNSQTELMKNQKHANVMSPDLAFDVLQTPAGDAIFFSIGTDHVFYVTREIRSNETGWTRVDLSSPLSKSNGGAAVKAKTFDISQNLATGRFDIALIVTVNGSDMLYMTRGKSSDASDWHQPIAWTKLRFDAAATLPPNPLTIADVYLMNIPSADDPTRLAVQNCFVDIIRTPGDPLQLLDRYYIKPDTPTKWVRHTLPADLKANSISSCLGHRADDYVPGIYTYGLIENTRELLFTPQYNYFRPDVAPNSARLALPTHASAIASAPDLAGNTNLFVAAADGLYLFAPDNQHDKAHATQVVPAVTVGTYNLFAGVSSVVATTVSDRTVVWLLNAQGNLFYVSCAAGFELKPNAWSNPVPFCAGVERFAFYLNGHDSNIVLFAHLMGQEMAQFTQDSTSAWTRRNILLPSTEPDDFIEFNSFTTNIKITDNNGVSIPEASLILTAKVPVSVYVNNIYHILSPDAPVLVTSDANGAVTVVQQTDSLSGVKVVATLGNDSSVTNIIDPLAIPTSRLASIRSGDDLSRVQIKDENGKQKPLIPGGVLPQQRDIVAHSITKLLKVKDDLTANGISKSDASRVSQGVSAPSSRATIVSRQAAIPLSEALGKRIEVAAGDLLNFLKMAWDEFEDVVIELAKDGWHFVVTIGGQIYTAILNTVSAVYKTVEVVFNKIEVFFEDLVAWLGFIFDWDDILRTHAVVKRELEQRATSYINNIDSVKDSVDSVFLDLENKLNTWAGVTDPGETIGIQQRKQSTIPSFHSPQSNWALYHTKNGIGSADTSGTEHSHDSSDDLQQVLEDLERLVSDETGHIETTITQIQEQVVKNISTLTALQVLEKILAIVGDLALKSTRSIVVKVLDIAKILFNGLLSLLDAPLEIPIISWIYKKITGSKLTILDLVCLIGAIPTTIAYKLVTGKSPFPDDSSVATAIAIADDIRKSRSKFQSSLSKPSSALSSKVATSSAHNATAGKRNTIRVQDLQAEDPWSQLDTLIMVFDIAALPGALLVGFLAFTRRAAAIDEEDPSGVTPSRVVRGLSAVSYLLYVAPNYNAWQSAGSWPVVMNDVVTGISIVKTFVDAVCLEPTWTAASPWVEFGINLVWVVPAMGGLVATPRPPAWVWTLFAANMMFDIGGMLTPVTSNPDFFVMSETLTAGYGILGPVTAALYHQDRT